MQRSRETQICLCANSLQCSWLLLGAWPAHPHIAQSFSLLPSIAVPALLQDGLLILSAKFGTKEAIAGAELAEQRHRRGGPSTSGSASADGAPQQPASPVQRRTRRPTWQPGKLWRPMLHTSELCQGCCKHTCRMWCSASYRSILCSAQHGVPIDRAVQKHYVADS